MENFNNGFENDLEVGAFEGELNPYTYDAYLVEQAQFEENNFDPSRRIFVSAFGAVIADPAGTVDILKKVFLPLVSNNEGAAESPESIKVRTAIKEFYTSLGTNLVKDPTIVRVFTEDEAKIAEQTLSSVAVHLKYIKDQMPEGNPFFSEVKALDVEKFLDDALNGAAVVKFDNPEDGKIELLELQISELSDPSELAQIVSNEATHLSLDFGSKLRAFPSDKSSGIYSIEAASDLVASLNLSYPKNNLEVSAEQERNARLKIVNHWGVTVNPGKSTQVLSALFAGRYVNFVQSRLFSEFLGAKIASGLRDSYGETEDNQRESIVDLLKFLPGYFPTATAASPDTKVSDVVNKLRADQYLIESTFDIDDPVDRLKLIGYYRYLFAGSIDGVTISSAAQANNSDVFDLNLETGQVEATQFNDINDDTTYIRFAPFELEVVANSDNTDIDPSKIGFINLAKSQRISKVQIRRADGSIDPYAGSLKAIDEDGGIMTSLYMPKDINNLALGDSIVITYRNETGTANIVNEVKIAPSITVE